jgi:hypothetical protein
VYGTYSTLAALAGVIVAMLALPGLFAAPLAARILFGLGLGTAAIGFLMPSKILACTKYTVEWQLKESANLAHTNTLVGSRYTITENSAYTGEVYYDVDYYGLSAPYAA